MTSIATSIATITVTWAIIGVYFRYCSFYNRTHANLFIILARVKICNFKFMFDNCWSMDAYENYINLSSVLMFCKIEIEKLIETASWTCSMLFVLCFVYYLKIFHVVRILKNPIWPPKKTRWRILLFLKCIIFYSKR